MKTHYESARLTFKRDVIEPLAMDDSFSVYVPREGGTYTMTKEEFYKIFDNVVNSRSYREQGSYNYKQTPKKALPYFSPVKDRTEETEEPRKSGFLKRLLNLKNR